MKKSILSLGVLLLTSISFAQGYTYNDASYTEVAERIYNLKSVDNLPQGFYFDRNSRGDMDSYVDRMQLFSLAENQYKQYPQSLAAVYNFARVLLTEADEQEGHFVPTKEAAQEAITVIRHGLQINPDSLELYKLLDLAFTYRDLGATAARGSDQKTRESVSSRFYHYNKEKAQERLDVFESRFDRQDRTLTEADFDEAISLCNILGKRALEEYYIEEKARMYDYDHD